MVTVTNLTQYSPRAFNVRRGTVGAAQQMVLPGETVELDVIDPENPIYKAWEDAKEIAYGAPDRVQQEAAERAPPPANEPGPGAAPPATPVHAMTADPASLTKAAGIEPKQPELQVARPPVTGEHGAAPGPARSVTSPPAALDLKDGPKGPGPKDEPAEPKKG